MIPNTLRSDGQMYAVHISALKIPAHWYHAVASFRLTDKSCINAVQRAQVKHPTSFLRLVYKVRTLNQLVIKRGVEVRSKTHGPKESFREKYC